MRVPRPTLMGFVAFLNFATACLGLPLTGPEGKLAVSNLTPIPFVVLGAVPYLTSLKTIPAEFGRYLLLFNISCLLSFAIFLVQFGWPPNVFVLLFLNVEVLFCAFIVLYARDCGEEFRTVVRAGIYTSIPICLFFGYLDVKHATGQLAFGMDDKSQAAVLLCMEAFILARFFGSTLDRITAIGLLGVSFLTISRLPTFFVPAVLVAVATQSRMGLAFVGFVACGIGAAFALYTDAVLNTFQVLYRLSDALDAGSTQSHFLLLRAAWTIKFTHLSAFLFGTGPSNFSKALMSFRPPELDMLRVVDPKLLVSAEIGVAPLHSTPMQLLLDYSIAVPVLLLLGAYRALASIWQALEFVDWLFIVGLICASSFYSIHDKHYFWLLGTTCAVLAVQRSATLSVTRRGRVPQAAHPAATAAPHSA